MKLAALVDENTILVHLDTDSYEGAVSRIVASLGERLGKLTPERVTERLLAVEGELPIPLGHGVRIPHARLGGINTLLLAIGTSQEGIPVDSTSSDERVQLIFVILTPKTQSALMLQTMSSIARLVNNEEIRKALVSTTTAARFVRILEESGIQVKKAIVAADLMNPVRFFVRPDMTLRQVVELLSSSREEGLPVVGEQDEFLGDISTRMVIEVGLPKYMNLISDAKILSEFEPFEAFYKKEDSTTADDVMNPNAVRLVSDTPVEIVAHELLTQHSERAYVVDEKKLIGIVYRKDIVRKVLNL